MTAKRLKAFISHAHKDRELAGKLKTCLGEIGIDGFLAHEDINPAAPWAPVIKKELRECDLFLPILTHEFKKSDWTDQETGAAVGTNKVILPLHVDLDPYGFIASIQALTLNPGKPRFACLTIVKTLLAATPELRERLLAGFVPKFARSKTYDIAGQNAAVLVAVDDYSAKQVKQVLKAIRENDQIYGSRSARSDVLAFLRKYSQAYPVLARKARRALK